MSPFALPRKVFDEFIDELIDYCQGRVNTKTSSILDTLIEMKSRPVFSEKYSENWEEGFVKGRNYQRRLAKIRNDGQNNQIQIEDIYGQRQKVLEWWEQKL